jgi:FKBP-type peptidyl-prolyl cis-trans isomerase
MQLLTRRTFGGLAFAIAATLGACALFGPPRPPDYTPFTTPSGVWIKDLTVPLADDQALVVAGASVEMHYEIALEDGTVVDSSRERGQPLRFVVGEESGLPSGVEDGLLGMKHKGRRTMRIPPELAFGSAGVPGVVPEDATIVVTVELLDVVPPAPSGG